MLMQKLLSGGVEEKLYSDDVFQTHLFSGNGGTRTLTTGLNLSAKGGLAIFKGRSGTYGGTFGSYWVDTARGLNNPLVSSSTAAQNTGYTSANAATTSGITIGGESPWNGTNTEYALWEFIKAPKFFDVVTYTGNGVAGRQIPHSLGIAPGMIIVKETNSVSYWKVWHRSLAAGYDLQLNTTDSQLNEPAWGTQTPTDIVAGSNAGFINASGVTYVAYLFAHDTSTDGIIQCGSFTTDGSRNATVNLGWEPQYLLLKATSTTSNWFTVDVMRGMPTDTSSSVLYSNLSTAEATAHTAQPTATGFTTKNAGLAATTTYIYLAIRRPNKPPTSGTQVYNAIARTGNSIVTKLTGVGFAPDMFTSLGRNNSSTPPLLMDRLRGSLPALQSSSTGAEQTSAQLLGLLEMDGVSFAADNEGYNNFSGRTYINHFFRRAVGVMSILCDTGTGSAHAVAHDLGAVPELMIRKGRSGATQWEVYFASLGNTKKLVLNSTAAEATDNTAWNSTTPTSTNITVGTGANVNTNTATYVTYLFSTLAGISKIGAYTGNGGTQNIDMGFSTGCRFFLVKASSTTGSWWLYDSTRGIVSSTDFGLQLNSTAAEVTSADCVDPFASGITVVEEGTCALNTNGVVYQYLAFA